MMKWRDVIESLTHAPLDSRVVLQTEGGVEIDLADVSHYGMLVVITPSQPVTTDGDLIRTLEDRNSELERQLIERDQIIAQMELDEQQRALNA